jgi:hypothetical protein
MTTALEGGKESASHPGRFLPPRKTRYPLYSRLGGPQGRSGQVWKISPTTGIRSPDRPARSQSPNRLSYGAHIYTSLGLEIYWSNKFSSMRFASTVLGAFTKLWRATASFVISVRLSVRHRQLGFHFTDFYDIFYFRFFFFENLSRKFKFYKIRSIKTRTFH